MDVEVVKIKSDGDITNEVLFSGQIVGYVGVNHAVCAVIKRDDGTFKEAQLIAMREIKKEKKDDRRDTGSISVERPESVDNARADGRTNKPASSKAGSTRKS